MPENPLATAPQPLTGARGLIHFALDTLPRMRHENGLYCTEVVAGVPAAVGTSLRYSLMTLIGLAKARSHGYGDPLDLERTAAALRGLRDAPDLRPGDLGLALWSAVLTGGVLGLVDRLEHSLSRDGGLAAREGMEAAWIVIGLAEHVQAGAPSRASRLLDEAVEHLLDRAHPRSGLVAHLGGRSPRGRFPNFATQIYAVLALAAVARTGRSGAGRARDAGRRIADRLLEQQLADGGWPWLYDVTTGRVLERYEIYTVHQDAMAPMGLLALAEVTGERAYAEAAVRGVEWIRGANELGVEMLDPDERILYRSIRRRRPWARTMLYANTAAAAVSGAGRLLGPAGGVELNRTDRPYHLGWVLEAWCGREDELSGEGAR